MLFIPRKKVIEMREQNLKEVMELQRKQNAEILKKYTNSKN